MRLENQQTLRGKPLSPELRAAIAALTPLELETVPTQINMIHKASVEKK